MAARAMWKAVVRVGDESAPVKLYAAVVDRKVHFHLLHDKDEVRVRQRLVHPDTGKPVPFEKTRRGFEVERGRFVVFDPEELAETEPAPSRDVVVVRFVDPAEIDHRWYARPYWLGPDGDDPKPYFALVEALRKRGREGVARWTMRKKAYVGALRVEGPYLALVTLRHAAEVIAASELRPPGGRALDAKEKSMAKQLVSALADDFRPEDYRDEHRARLRGLVKAKARGEKIAVGKFRPKKERGGSLSDTLAASVAEARRKKSA